MNDTVIHGDALSVLRGMADNSVDAIVSDPPAGIEFMGKEWDSFKQGRLKNYKSQPGGKIGSNPGEGADFSARLGALPNTHQKANPKCLKCNKYKWDWPDRKCVCELPDWKIDNSARETFIAFLREVMTEALRVLKPGGHALIWALPRTSHWTATALEDAGFEVRDKLYHLFGSGFPKSLDISKAIDRMQGAEREVVGQKIRLGDKKPYAHNPTPGNEWNERYGLKTWRDPETKPATPEAQHWQGYGTALKPSCEEWILVRKPLAESSIAAQVLATGTGGLAIDACRVGTDIMPAHTQGRGQGSLRFHGHTHEELKTLAKLGAKTTDGRDATTILERFERNKNVEVPAHQGRFPSHLLLSHSVFCQPTSCEPDLCPIAELDRQSGVRKSTGGFKAGSTGAFGKSGIYSSANGEKSDRTMTGYGDSGTVSRYFTNFPPDDYTPYIYQAKASRAERNRGCENLPEVTRGVADGERVSNTLKGPTNMLRPDKATVSQNNHPTVKSTSLMRWLIRLITPPDGIVLDPFCGSGSTCVAAIQENKHFIGIEQDPSYVAICEARIAHATEETQLTQANRELGWLIEVEEVPA